jgi:SAM-dependent methyltransferase
VPSMRWGDSVRDRIRPVVDAAAPAREVRLLAATKRLHASLPTGPATVLDVGCQEGPLALELAETRQRWTVIGVDLDRSMLAAAKESAARAGLGNVRFAVQDATVLGRSEHFDAVVLLECLTEIPDDEAAIVQAVRSLRPGGVLFVHVPVADWRPVLPGSRDRWASEVRRGYDAARLHEMLRAAAPVSEIEIVSSQHAPVQACQELVERLRTRPLWMRIPVVLAGRLAVWAEQRRLTPGRPRALLLCARRA